MSKFRRSRLFKFIAGSLIFILAVAIVGNIAGTLLLMGENLLYANRVHIQQKVYLYIYDYTAGDLMQYLRVAENMQTNNENYKNYNRSEMDLYRSKYSSENSNIQFTITDEQGHILLKNDNIRSDECFVYSSVYVTDTEYYSSYYQQGYSEKSEIETEPLPSTMPDTTFIAEETILYNEGTEQITAIDTNATEELQQQIPSPDTTAITVSEIDNSKYLLEEVTVQNTNSDNATTLHYYYQDNLNYNILNHCKDITENLNFDISEISFWQDDFVLSDETEDYYEDGYQIFQKYGITDSSVPEKSFSTTLFSNGKEIDITYTYNGSFYPEAFTNRLSAASLILENSDDNVEMLTFYQKSRIQLKVEVLVPYSSYINDIYKFAENVIDIAIFYRDNIITFTIFDAILFIMSFIYIFWSAGYVPKKEFPVARGMHRLPFDVYIFISLLLGVGCVAMISTSDELFIFLGIIGLALLLLSLVYTLTVRLRTATLKKNTLLFKIYATVKNAVSTMNEASGSKLTVLLILLIFATVTAGEIFILFVFNFDYSEISIFIFLLRLIEMPVLLLLLISLIAVHNGARAISKGDISYRINNPLLFGPIKKHAEYLNSINNAVNSAVEERLKSESLKTELITNVSHDLKTPLTSIVNYVDLLKKEEINNPKANEYIEVIDRQSQRLKKLTVDIVEASKAATGNIEVHFEKTALNVMLLQTNGEYIERLEEKSLTLIQEIPDETVTVSTDGRLLWRIIDNLMNNICKYSMPGTRVYLTLTKIEDEAIISFRNISKDKLNVSPDTLTERFVRGDTSRNTEGSGLGLSIANSLAKVIGGKLTVTIDGDLFKVTLQFPLSLN